MDNVVTANAVAIQLQAMQLNSARDAIAKAQVEQTAMMPNPGAAAQPVPDVILDLSLAAQQLLGG